MVTGVVVPLQVYALTRSPAAVGLVSLVEAVPTIALGLFGGALADSFDRRRLLALTSGLSALVSAVFALQAALGVRQLWLLLLLAGVQACLFALSTPVSRTFMPLLLPPERYTEGAALQQMSFQASVVAGPLLAGVLIASAGAATAYALDAVSFVFVVRSALRLPPMPARRKADAPGLASVTEGLRFVRDHAALRSVLLLDVNNTVFGMPFALFPAFAQGQLHGGPRTAGLLYAAPAAGGVLAAAASGALPGVRRQGRALLAAGCCWGLAVAGFGLARSVWLAVPLLAVAGAADMVGGVFPVGDPPDAHPGRPARPGERGRLRDRRGRTAAGQRRGGRGGLPRLTRVQRRQRGSRLPRGPLPCRGQDSRAAAVRARSAPRAARPGGGRHLIRRGCPRGSGVGLRGEAPQQGQQGGAVGGGERGEAGGEDLVGDGVPGGQDLLARGGEVVGDAAAAAGAAFDEVLGGQPGGEGAEGLLGLEGRRRELAGRGAGRAADRAQGVPLGEGRADGREGGVEGPVLAVLGLLDRPAEFLQLTMHGASLEHD